MFIKLFGSYVFVVEVLVCEQKIQIKAVVFIWGGILCNYIAPHIVATDQGSSTIKVAAFNQVAKYSNYLKFKML